MTVAVEPRRLRHACGHFGTGVTVITTRCNGHDHGMTANAFMSVSLEPPLIAVSIAATAKLLPRLQVSGRFGVSILADTMDGIAWHFAGKPNPELTDLLDVVDGLPVVRGAVATFTADVHDEVVAGDHTVVIGHVTSLAVFEDRTPLLFFRGRFAELAATESALVDVSQLDRELIW